jgi:hypothetical protein
VLPPPITANACPKAGSRITAEKLFDRLPAHPIEIVWNGDLAGKETQSHILFRRRIQRHDLHQRLTRPLSQWLDSFETTNGLFLPAD